MLRTVIRPMRGDVPGFAATVKATGLSPERGMLLVIVIHGTSDRAVHTHRSCKGPPHVFGSLNWMTLNTPLPPAELKFSPPGFTE